jgi:hypothetical protein
MNTYIFTKLPKWVLDVNLEPLYNAAYHFLVQNNWIIFPIILPGMNAGGATTPSKIPNKAGEKRLIKNCREPRGG